MKSSNNNKIIDLLNDYTNNNIKKSCKKFKKLSKFEKFKLFNYLSNLYIYNRYDMTLFIIKFNILINR